MKERCDRILRTCISYLFKEKWVVDDNYEWVKSWNCEVNTMTYIFLFCSFIGSTWLFLVDLLQRRFSTLLTNCYTLQGQWSSSNRGNWFTAHGSNRRCYSSSGWYNKCTNSWSGICIFSLFICFYNIVIIRLFKYLNLPGDLFLLLPILLATCPRMSSL